MSAEPPIYGYCPHCGAEVPEEALACPECGSCSETGWSTKASYDRIGVDSDDEPFDYEGFLEEELEMADPRGDRPCNGCGPSWPSCSLVFSSNIRWLCEP